METKLGLLRNLIFFVEANDVDLLESPRVLGRDLCAPSERASVRRAATLIQEVYTGSQYAASPEFLASVRGKSAAYREMKARMVSQPVKHSEYRARLVRAFDTLLAGQEIYDVVSESYHPHLDEVRAILSSVSNPE